MGERKVLTIAEKIQLKEDKVSKLDAKICDLNKKRNKLNSELETLKAIAKAKEYEALEISLKESGLTLEELLKTININKRSVESVTKL